MRTNKGLSFVAIMIIIAISALLLRVIVERIIKINITQDESNALATLKLISTALENYAKDNKGAFPSEFSALINAKPAYLDQDYIGKPSIKGYAFDCQSLTPTGYFCQAIPIKCMLTGNTIYTVTTGNLLVSEQCNKKE